MRILGLSAFHRDAAAAVVVDGMPVAAAQEERFTRKRGDASFPRRAIRSCLAQAGIDARDLDRVVFYEKPLRKFERMLAMQLQAFPRSSRVFARSMFAWLGDRLWMKSRIARELAVDPGVVGFVEHQLAHGASAFFASPYPDAAVLTIDDAGEWATATLGRGSGGTLEILAELAFPHSLGLVASAVTQFLGFEPGADEWKVEALARLGTPQFERELESLVPARAAGAFEIDPVAFRFAFDHERLFGDRLAEILGPPRAPGAPLRHAAPDARDADVAASLQRLLETRTLALARELHARVRGTALCFAGALAANRAVVARLAYEGPFEELFVPPEPSEAGAALGAALVVAHAIEGEPRRFHPRCAALGEPIDDRAETGARPLGDASAARSEVAARVARGEVVAWVRGPLELAAHSLGNRCILADARGEGARARLLAAVQQSEPWLPCRIAAPAERAGELFDLPRGSRSLLRFGHVDVAAAPAARLAAPSAIQPGGAAWVQLVDAEDDPDLHAVLGTIAERTGAPLALIDTLRLRGQPMVRTETDAVEAFRRSRLDALVVEDRLYVPE